MYNVILFGTGSSADIVLKLLNDECCVICFLDNNQNKWGKHKGIEVKNPKEIKNIKYDYIIIASQYNDDIFNQLVSLGVDENDIVQFYKLTNYEHNYVSERLELLDNKEIKNELIVTGLSYCQSGINTELLNIPGLKLAFGSQDLYYDYNIAKYVIGKDKFEIIKYCIIGLSYYSFQYDLSLSVMKDRVYHYYKVLGLYHNNPHVKYMKDEYENSKKIADKIFIGGLSENNTYPLVEFKESSIEKKQEIGRERAVSDCNKNYPLTVKENKEIFNDYLKLLKQNNIKPIVVICPTTKYYNFNFSEKIENEFKSIINEFKDKYDFQYIDYFRSDLFEDSDFSDVSHLNDIGSKKFTKILNEEIQWDNNL